MSKDVSTKSLMSIFTRISSDIAASRNIQQNLVKNICAAARNISSAKNSVSDFDQSSKSYAERIKKIKKSIESRSFPLIKSNLRIVFRQLHEFTLSEIEEVLKYGHAPEYISENAQAGWNSDRCSTLRNHLKLLSDFRIPILNGRLSWEDLANRDELVKRLLTSSEKISSLAEFESAARKLPRPRSELSRLLHSCLYFTAAENPDLFLDLSKSSSISLGMVGLLPWLEKDLQSKSGESGHQQPIENLTDIVLTAAVLRSSTKPSKSTNILLHHYSLLKRVKEKRFAGDPRKMPQNTFWSRVRQIEPEALLRWSSSLNTEDIEFFFANIVVNSDRRDFWLRYYRAAERTIVIMSNKEKLNLSKQYSTNPLNLQIIERAKTFKSSGTHTHNSIVFIFRNFVAIEGSKTGLACSLWDRAEFEKRHPSVTSWENVEISVSSAGEFRHGRLDSFSHHSNWESAAIRMLRNLGILESNL